MASLTATVDAGVDAVILTYEVTTPQARTISISRTGPSGTPAYVRGYASAPAVAGSVLVRDFEAPIAVPLTYTLISKGVTGDTIDTLTATVTVPVQGRPGCDTWLNDLARVGNTMRVVVQSLEELEYPVPTSVHEIVTRRDPIITSDIAHTPAFELQFLTATDAERDKATALLGNGIPVLLRTPPEDGIGNLYLSVLGYSEQRLVVEPTVKDRRFVVSGRQVTRPDPTLYQPIGASTYTKVRDNYTDYAELRAERVNYDAVLYDWTGTQAADIVPWPPTDV